VELVQSHCAATQPIASGIHAVPGAASALSMAQAAYRFLKNPRVTLQSLAAPLIAAAREQVPLACDHYLLVVHDWSQLMYPDHAEKKDRLALSSKQVPEGYEALTALLVSDRDGSPIAPVAVSLRAADGVHCSRSWQVRSPLSPLDELDPAMTYVEQLSWDRPTVHVVDAEADSVGHFRQWSERPGRLYLVRGDDRLVEHEGRERRCSEIQAELRERQAFHYTRDVQYHGQKVQQFVAEVAIRLVRPAQRNRPAAGDRQRIPGPPVSLRLVMAEVRSSEGTVLATWFLLTNVPDEVPAPTIALWYYWRWTIEEFFKLLKSAGVQVEEWQQHTAAAIAKRLLVACMACVVVWRLARSEHPLARPARRLLVQLSGRQIARGKEFTLPSMLSGLWVLLAMLHALEQHTVEELHALGRLVLGEAMPAAP